MLFQRRRADVRQKHRSAEIPAIEQFDDERLYRRQFVARRRGVPRAAVFLRGASARASKKPSMILRRNSLLNNATP
jgi:hypothetical protein